WEEMTCLFAPSLGPSLWHMHPLKFLASLIQTNVNIRILRLRAFLRMIRIGEGTIQEDGYRTMFTGAKFTNFSKHPNTRHEANGVVSTAAGAYQFLYGTWRNLQRRYSFSDFSQSNQDLGCIALIAGRKALDAVMQDKISEAIHLCRIEWASLPGSPHGQPTANKKMIMEKYEVYLAEEKLGKTSLHATSEEMTKFIEDNYPEYL
ncbi:glycoside hydrolase family 24 protein, partial [Klebsiella sp. CFKP142]